MPVVIAVDGPAASGKGTLARRIAAHYGFVYLDTGLLYRAVGVKIMAGGGDLTDEEAISAEADAVVRALSLDELTDPALRDDTAAHAASKVAALPAVRSALVDFQRSIAFDATQKGAVLDGRDIGSVICPDARCKLFITAPVEIRARRRYKELQERGKRAIYADVLRAIRERDARDTERGCAPLMPADDAFILDTGALSPDEVFIKVITCINEKCILEP